MRNRQGRRYATRRPSLPCRFQTIELRHCKNQAMNVAFRTDASMTIGHGHIMRCLTLAETLREHGAAVLFVCREHNGHLCALIEERGFTVSRLPAPKPGTQAEGATAYAA